MRRNALGVMRTIAAMRTLGCIEPVDEAVVALVRSTAENLDLAERGTAAAASCARAHTAAVAQLRELSRHDAGDALDDLLRLGTLGDASAT